MNRPFLPLLSLVALLLAGCSDLGGGPKETDWKTYRSESYGFSVESPFPIEFEEKEELTKAGFTVRSVRGKHEMAKASPLRSLVDILGHRFTGELKLRYLSLEVDSFRLPANMIWSNDKLLEAQETVIRKGFGEDKWEDFRFEGTKVECSGLPAVQLEGTFHLKRLVHPKPKVRYSSLICSRGTQCWKFSLLCGDIEEYRGIKERLFKSVKIDPPAP